MEARDFRGLGRPAQEALRRRALFLIEHEGTTQAAAARAVGVHRQTVNVWLKRYRERGEDGVLDGRRVSPRRGKGRLTAAEAGKARGWIADGTPDQLELPFALWTSRAVRELIERRFGKRLGLSTVQLYLRRWGMTPQKPLVRAKERTPAAIEAWLERDYPAIAKRARAERAAIYWGDETGISNQDQIGRSYAPKGRTPVVTRTAKRLTQSMIAAISNRGLTLLCQISESVRKFKGLDFRAESHNPLIFMGIRSKSDRVVLMRFMLYEGALDVERLLAFLRRLVRDARQKVFLIVDNLKVHHAGKVRAWVASHAHEIELFYLPAYAPEHNPDECLNRDLKQKLRQKPQPGAKEDLIKSTRSVLRVIQRSPRRVRAYFTPEPVRYAA